MNKYTITIRLFERSDLDQIVTLFYETVHAVNIQDYSAEHIKAWAPEEIDRERWMEKLSVNIAYVAIYQNTIVGFADMTAQGYVDKVYTHKAHQRRGIASHLLKKLEQTASEKGLLELTTESSITARPFFEKHGFACLEKLNKEYRGQFFLTYSMNKRIG